MPLQIEAFIELYGEENVGSFEDAYQGEYESGAHFAESLVSDCYCLDIPAFVVASTGKQRGMNFTTIIPSKMVMSSATISETM